MLLQRPWGPQGEPVAHSSTSNGAAQSGWAPPPGGQGGREGTWGDVGTCAAPVAQLEAVVARPALEGARRVDALLAGAGQVVLALVDVCAARRGGGGGTAGRAWVVAPWMGRSRMGTPQMGTPRTGRLRMGSPWMLTPWLATLWHGDPHGC